MAMVIILAFGILLSGGFLVFITGQNKNIKRDIEIIELIILQNEMIRNIARTLKKEIEEIRARNNPKIKK